MAHPAEPLQLHARPGATELIDARVDVGVGHERVVVAVAEEHVGADATGGGRERRIVQYPVKRDHAAQSVRIATCPVECGPSAEAETNRGGARAVDARAAEIVGVGACSVERGADARTAQVAVCNECS